MQEVRYLNVDLLVKSRIDLTPIVNEFGEDVLVLTNGKAGDFYHAYFEIAGSHAGPNEDIGYFCSLIESLDQNERELWDNSISKIFDVGFESGEAPQSYSADIRPETIKRMSQCGASIRITVYPSDQGNKERH